MNEANKSTCGCQNCAGAACTCGCQKPASKVECANCACAKSKGSRT
jgi:hypothetical protein